MMGAPDNPSAFPVNDAINSVWGDPRYYSAVIESLPRVGQTVGLNRELWPEGAFGDADLASARATQASPRASKRLGHPVSIAIAGEDK